MMRNIFENTWSMRERAGDIFIEKAVGEIYEYSHGVARKISLMHADWAGQTESIVDRDNGEIIPAYVFAAVLAGSGYAYVEAFLSQDHESWLKPKKA